MTRTNYDNKAYIEAMKKLTKVNLEDDKEFEKEIFIMVLGSKENYEKMEEVCNLSKKRG